MAHTPPSSFHASPEPPTPAHLSHFEAVKPQGSPSNIHKAAAELLGTYMLVFIGCGSMLVDQKSNLTLVGIALVWAAAVVALVYTFGHISGAHANPAITVAFAAIGRFPWKHVPLYVTAQVVGSVAASFTLRWLFHGYRADGMLSHPSNSTDDLRAIAMEIIVSFMLMFVICTTSRAIKELSGVAIGATVFCNIIIAGKITGCSMNPARSIGPAIATTNFHKIWIYMFSPMIGTVAGSMVDHVLHLPGKKTANLLSIKL